ncbi:MAG: neutral/alkaline non-lysosomal ceramidase N-terminal domain-containing protein [Saprospiraceae bacterium]|nr:neutral/alkaline non-lysosomal ceramidase N-terminal domain-containing protein [Saprospiraceae bacterium]
MIEFSRRSFLSGMSMGTTSLMLPHFLRKPLYLQGGGPDSLDWQVGIGKRIITPTISVWLAGYGTQRIAYGKIHDLFVKVLALKCSNGKIAVLATTDNQGMSRTVYENIFRKVNQRYNLDRSEFMLTFSHNHSGPCLQDDLVDYYPSDDAQKELVNQYSEWMAEQVVEAVGEALSNWQPAQLFKGEGKCTFAVNRRDNVESVVPDLLEAGKPLEGVVDHYVPVLAIKGPGGNLISVLFGYACHPTTLSISTWSGDYPGFAQIDIESAHPGTAAMFFNACGGDQNPIPRRTVALCEKYGKQLAQSVEEVLAGQMEPIRSDIKTAFEYVPLEYLELVTEEKLKPIATGSDTLHARWATRMLKKLEDGVKFQNSHPYPVQAWQLGKELLFLGIGGEAVVDYSLRFKSEYNNQTTWVCGYANEMVAYIPSRRIWEEGGYEGGPHLDEYGHPAWRWAGDVEDRISETVRKVVEKVQF